MSWVNLFLGGAIAWLALYVHRRRLGWAALILAAVAGTLLGASVLARLVGYMTGWAGWVAFLPFLLVLTGLVVIALDLRDKKPDKPAVLFAVLVPLFLAAAWAQAPTVLDNIGDAFGDLGANVSANTGR